MIPLLQNMYEESKWWKVCFLFMGLEYLDRTCHCCTAQYLAEI